MKIFAALAALPLTAIPMQCNPQPPAVAPSPAHQSARGVALDAQSACGKFTASIFNSNDAAVTVTIKVDGQYSDTLYASSGSIDETALYFPHHSGEHKVTVLWPGGASNWPVFTDCT